MPRRNREPRHWSRAIGGVLLAAILTLHAVVLMQRPVVGTAENGDFWRVMRPAGILPIDAFSAVYHQYVSQFYAMAESHLSSGFSSAALIAVGAKYLRHGGTTMDIRQVGAAYLALVALAFALALWAGVHPLLCALLAWAALDVSYSLYFNSFFADGAALVGILGISLALLAWPSESSGAERRVHHALLVLAALCVGLSKNLYMQTPLLAVGVVLAWPSRAWAAHARAAAALIAVLLLSGAVSVWHFTYGSGYRFPEINNHHAVFLGVANIDDPAQVLAELGIGPQYRRFVGKTFFDLSAEDQQISGRVLRDLSRTDIALAYLRAPRRVVRAIGVALPSLRQRTTTDPNFDDRSRPPATYTGWWQFARLRASLWWCAVVLWIAGCTALLRAAWTHDWHGEHAALAFLLLNAITVLVASLLGDGFFALPRHSMGTRFSLDLALALVLYTCARRLWQVIDPARRRPLPAVQTTSLPTAVR